MAGNLTRRQTREKKKREKKVQMERMRIQQQQEEIKKQALQVIQQKAIQQQPQQGGPTSLIVNYIADRNGCGYYRCIWPTELLATHENMMTINTFLYDQTNLHKTSLYRFQRQATTSQRTAWDNYIQMRRQHGYRYNMQYEIDDLLMEIEPYNKIAYEYFDEEKKQNHMHMLRTSDSITFSTEPLKDIYVKDYGIDPNKIRVVKNYLPQFLYHLPYRHSVKKFDSSKKETKPRIFWSGSASHVGPEGDLAFLIPMIEKTLDEYQWVFQGVIPPELVQHVKSGKIEFHPWVPTYGLAISQFYKAKPDICLAPLKPSRFNSVKSDLKYLEGCALGSPCITTSFEGSGYKSPYEDAGAEICIEPDADTWKTMIDYLVENPDYYLDTIKKQYEFLNGRWMEQNLHHWKAALV